ncbi:hypothetical protein [Ruegeria arenilitoris]|uniref:hypothetical protein n=1 Tax=Ruegeria arenilitoris TaxID=1173585 RepID=UPI00112FDBF8|nr:hypothetical protein [Ruegeria arenilitoris]
MKRCGSSATHNPTFMQARVPDTGFFHAVSEAGGIQKNFEKKVCAGLLLPARIYCFRVNFWLSNALKKRGFSRSPNHPLFILRALLVALAVGLRVRLHRSTAMARSLRASGSGDPVCGAYTSFGAVALRVSASLKSAFWCGFGPTSARCAFGIPSALRATAGFRLPFSVGFV